MSRDVIYDRVEFAGGWLTFRIRADGNFDLVYSVQAGDAVGVWSPYNGEGFPPTYAESDLLMLRQQLGRLARDISKALVDAEQVTRDGTMYIETAPPP